MIDPTLLAKINELSQAERLELIGVVWDSLSHADLPITDAEKQMLDARLTDADAYPDAESPLSEVVSRLERQDH